MRFSASSQLSTLRAVIPLPSAAPSLLSADFSRLFDVVKFMQKQYNFRLRRAGNQFRRDSAQIVFHSIGSYEVITRDGSPSHANLAIMLQIVQSPAPQFQGRNGFSAV